MAAKKKKITQKNRSVYIFSDNYWGLKESFEEAGYDVKQFSPSTVDFQTVVLSASPDAAVIHSYNLLNCEFDAEKIKTCSTTVIFLLVTDFCECQRLLREKSEILGKRMLWIRCPYSHKHLISVVNFLCPPLPDPVKNRNISNEEMNFYNLGRLAAPALATLNENISSEEKIPISENQKADEEDLQYKKHCRKKAEDFSESAEIKTGYEFFTEAIFIAAYDTSSSKTYAGTVLKWVAEKTGTTPDISQKQIKKAIKAALKNPFNSFFYEYVNKIGDNPNDRKIIMEIGNDIMNKYVQKKSK